MAPTAPAPSPRPRIAARGRPLHDPGCAGCGQLVLLRALRRAGLELEGGLGCEPAAPAPPAAPEGRRARLVSAADALARPGALVGASRGVALLAIADRGLHRAAAIVASLSAAGAEPRVLAPDASASDAERAVLEAAAAGAAVVAVVACARGAPRAAPLAIDPARCNRCGACLGLGCVAISDAGGDALAIDAGSCTGCGRCTPLCRARAISPRRP